MLAEWIMFARRQKTKTDTRCIETRTEISDLRYQRRRLREKIHQRLPQLCAVLVRVHMGQARVHQRHTLIQTSTGARKPMMLLLLMLLLWHGHWLALRLLRGRICIGKAEKVEHRRLRRGADVHVRAMRE
jgi:hypothetical protein